MKLKVVLNTELRKSEKLRLKTKKFVTCLILSSSETRREVLMIVIRGISILCKELCKEKGVDTDFSLVSNRKF